MAAAVDISMIGDKALQRKFAKLTPAIQKKIARKSFRKAAKLIKASARAKVSVESGALKRGIAVKSAKRKRGRGGQIGIAVVTPTREKLGIDASYPWYYPAVIEYGSKNHAARPYLRPALDSNRRRALALIGDDLREAVREAKRL